MPKVRLRPAPFAACLLLAAAPAAAQEKSLRTQIGDAVTAAHQYQRSIEYAREGDRQAALAEIKAEYDRREFVAQVRPRCKGFPLWTMAEDLAPFVARKAVPAALLVCAAFDTANKDEVLSKETPLQQAIRKSNEAPR